MQTSVVIPHYKHLDLTCNLVESLRKHDGENIDEIVLVNDGCFDKNVMEYQWAESLNGVAILNMPDNCGFLKTANYGLIMAKGDIKILISNDVEINTAFVKRLANILEEEPRALVGHHYLDWNTGWNTFDGKVFPYLEGYFLAATARTWDELDYFDVRYAPQDMEDNHLSTLAASQGRKLIEMADTGIRHLGAQTIGYNPTRELHTIANKELFRQIWVK